MVVIWETCGTCHGAGGWMVPKPDGKGGMILMECKACNGKGEKSRIV